MEFVQTGCFNFNDVPFFVIVDNGEMPVKSFGICFDCEFDLNIFFGEIPFDIDCFLAGSGAAALRHTRRSA